MVEDSADDTASASNVGVMEVWIAQPHDILRIFVPGGLILCRDRNVRRCKECEQEDPPEKFFL